MANEDRPLSPHLQVYRLPLTAVLSITHRLTGVAISLGAALLVGVLVALASGPRAYAEVQPLLVSWPVMLILLAFTFALYFHFCNGIRHLFWDAGYGFELATVDKSSIAVLVVTVVLTLATWLVALG